MVTQDLVALIEAAIASRAPRRTGDEIEFLCPAHEDHDPSAGWNRRKGVWKCLSCGAGGSARDLAERLGIHIETPKERAEKGRIVKEYDYRDEAGELLFQCVRMEPKDFRQRQPTGNPANPWKWSLEGARLVLYRLPELLRSKGARVYVPEGEKDVDNLHTRGLTATCNPMGATKSGKSKWYPEKYNHYLEGREVILLQDNDQAGENHCRFVAQSLYGSALRIKVLSLPGLPEKGDVSDWLAQGGTVEELERLADECAEWAPPADPVGLLSFGTTDSGNAELFAHLYGDRVRYDHLRGRWLLWAGHRWQADPNGELYRLAKEAARTRFRAAADSDIDGETRRKVVSWAISSESASKIDAMLKLARNEHPITDAGMGWDVLPFMLGTENGVANLVTGECGPGRIEDRITMSCGIHYSRTAECPRWIQFLDEVFCGDQEMVAFIQRAVGYSLTGSVKEQVWFLCHGSGANGKSTFLDTVFALGGEYSGDTPAETLMKRGAMGNIPTDVAALVGKRVVTCSETEEIAGLNSSRIKALTGGNPVTARFLRQDFFTFNPQLKLWLTTNHLPRVDDDSEGFWRRVRLIPFARSFSGPERDPNLEDKLKTELPGILNWAIAGAVEWSKSGLRPPTSVMLATHNYRQHSDPLAEFISDCCVIGEGVRATKGQLFEAYKGWAKDQGYSERDMLAARSFGRRIGERWPERRSGSSRWHYGIGVRAGDLSDKTDPEVTEPLLSPHETELNARSIGLAWEQTDFSVTSVTSVTPPDSDHCTCRPACFDGPECEDGEWWDDEQGKAHCMAHHPVEV